MCEPQCRRVEVPYDLLCRRNFVNVKLARHQNITVPHHPDVVNLAAFAEAVRPDHLPVIDDENLVITFARVEHRMLREPVTLQNRNVRRLGPAMRNRRCFFRPADWYGRSSEFAKHGKHRLSQHRSRPQRGHSSACLFTRTTGEKTKRARK